MTGILVWQIDKRGNNLDPNAKRWYQLRMNLGPVIVSPQGAVLARVEIWDCFHNEKEKREGTLQTMPKTDCENLDEVLTALQYVVEHSQTG